MRQQTCSECGKTKNISDFGGVPKILRGLCFACWENKTEKKWAGSGFASAQAEQRESRTLRTYQPDMRSTSQFLQFTSSIERNSRITFATLIILVVTVVTASVILVHRSDPCNVLPPADHRVLEFIESKNGSVRYAEVSELTGLSLSTVAASAQRLEECERIASY